MAKPIINIITPFDVADGTMIKFAYSGAQPYSNKLKVYRADTLAVVFEDIESTMKLQHTIPPNSTLVNGVQYAAEITCYDNEDRASAPSNKAFFWCLDTPEFYFTSISSGQTFDMSSVTADVHYFQAQYEYLASYKFYLYDSTQKLIFETDTFYDEDNITYTFKGLDNLQTYYAQCVGVTQKGTVVDTGMVDFFIRFKNPTSYAYLYAESDGGNGVVDYWTNLKIIEDTSGKEYQYDNSFIILDNDILTYDSGFVIDGDFTMAIRHTYTTGVIMRCENEDTGFTLEVLECPDGMYRYKLIVPNGVCNYVLYSVPFEMDSMTVVVCWIRRINNVYQLAVFADDEFDDVHNMWLQENQPVRNLNTYDIWIDLNASTSYIAKDDVVIWTQEEEPEYAEENNIWIDVKVEGGFSV